MLARRITNTTIKHTIKSCTSTSIRSMSTRNSIDVHTHMYLPKYMDLLKSRTDVPFVRTINNEDRLVILPGEDEESTTAIGRPIGKEYYYDNDKNDDDNETHFTIQYYNIITYR